MFLLNDIGGISDERLLRPPERNQKSLYEVYCELITQGYMMTITFRNSISMRRN